MKKRKDPYVVFDPSDGLKKERSEGESQNPNEKKYGDLRIRSGVGAHGVIEVPVFPWLVWSIHKKMFHLETAGVDIPEFDLTLAKEAVSARPKRPARRPARRRKSSAKRGKK